MSEHSVVRQRLAALDAAIEALEGWGTGESGGPIGVWSDRMSVDAMKHGDSDEGEGRCWINAAGIYLALVDLRGQLVDFAATVERQAMENGAATWEVSQR